MPPRKSVAKLQKQAAPSSSTNSSGQKRNQNRDALPTIQTHRGLSNATFGSFAEFLATRLPDVTYGEADNALELASYCRQSIMYMDTAIEALLNREAAADHADWNEMGVDEAVVGEPDRDSEGPLISLEERDRLMRLRDQWIDHLCAYKYSLWMPPPLSGGVTSHYSLATQLWLLILRSDALLQCANCVPDLESFLPLQSAYLSQQRLVIDTAPLVEYTQRTVVQTLCNFVERLDTLTGWCADYTFFTRALEHRVATLVCFGGAVELDAAEWCVVRTRVAAAPAAADETLDGGARRVSEEFLTHTMALFCTLREYEENALQLRRLAAVSVPGGLRSGIGGILEPRAPDWAEADEPWRLPAHAMSGASAFFCMYSRDNLVDESFRANMRNLLRNFYLRPCDLDLYRLLQRRHEINAVAAVSHQYEHRSIVMDAYANYVQFEWSIHEYVCQALQWREGCVVTTRSTSIGLRRFMAQLAVLFVWNQFLIGQYRFDFRQRCMLFQRDAAYPTTLRRIQSNGARYPIIVQQFGYFVLLVPPHRHFDTTQVHRCETMFDAIAAWCVWLTSISGGKITDQRTIDLSPCFEDIYGAAYLRQAVATIEPAAVAAAAPPAPLPLPLEPLH